MDFTTVDTFLASYLDSFYAVQVADILPRPKFTDPEREILSQEVVEVSRCGEQNFFEAFSALTRTETHTTYGPYRTLGGVCTNMVEIEHAKAILDEALATGLVYVDRRGYLRPNGFVGEYDLRA